MISLTAATRSSVASYAVMCNLARSISRTRVTPLSVVRTFSAIG